MQSPFFAPNMEDDHAQAPSPPNLHRPRGGAWDTRGCDRISKQTSSRADTIANRALVTFTFGLFLPFPATQLNGAEMPVDEKQRFAEALEHWSLEIQALRARERAEAIAQVEELEKMQARRAFHACALGRHHVWKHRDQG